MSNEPSNPTSTVHGPAVPENPKPDSPEPEGTPMKGGPVDYNFEPVMHGILLWLDRGRARTAANLTTMLNSDAISIGYALTSLVAAGFVSKRYLEGIDDFYEITSSGQEFLRIQDEEAKHPWPLASP